MIYARIAVPVDGEVVGETIYTKATETSDDPGLDGGDLIEGQGVPLLAALALPADGGVQGETILTRSGAETSDDEPRWG